MKNYLVELLQRILSRKFLGAIALTIVAYNSGMMDGVLSEKELITIIAPIMAFIGVEGWADAKGR